MPRECRCEITTVRCVRELLQIPPASIPRLQSNAPEQNFVSGSRRISSSSRRHLAPVSDAWIPADVFTPCPVLPCGWDSTQPSPAAFSTVPDPPVFSFPSGEIPGRRTATTQSKASGDLIIRIHPASGLDNTSTPKASLDRRDDPLISREGCKGHAGICPSPAPAVRFHRVVYL